MAIKKKTDIKQYSNRNEDTARDAMLHLLKGAPVPDDQLLSNLGLFLESKNLARLLFMDFIYRQIVDVQGVIMEENPQTVTVQTANETVAIPTAEIEARKDSPMSMMPEGLFDRLSPEEIRDLVAYLGSSR